MKNSRAYSVLSQIAVLLTILGTLTLLAGILPVTTGKNPSQLELAGGLSVLILGLVFLVLSDLGARLFRIEAKLGTLPKDDFAKETPDSPPDAP
jgi:hypothetical protein